MRDSLVPVRRLVAAALAVAVCLSVAATLPGAGATTDPDLVVTLELPAGDVDYRLELGTLQLFTEEDAPFAVQVIDGCSVNGHLWLFGAGISGMPVPVTLLDVRSGESHRAVLPAYEPGAPIGTIVEPEALSVCGDEQAGGLPPLRGTASFISATSTGADFSDAIELLADGADDAYRRLVRSGTTYPVVSKGSPVVAVDESGAFDELALIAEGRTPRRLEGIVFSGPEGMLPPRATLDKALKSIDRSRVRRAFETAKNRRVPQGIVEDLGLRDVEGVHHLKLDFETLGADAYLALAGMIRQRGGIEPPVPVRERFTVELAQASGDRTPIPLVGPLVGSESEGLLWQYRSDDALVQIVDACDLAGAYWLMAGAITPEPVELVVTDSDTGTSESRLLWTDREEMSRLADSVLPESCP